jgi:hypothetical protein
MTGASEAVRYSQDEPLSQASWANGRAPQFSKVPEVALGFWIIKILATTLGETGGDAVTMSMNLGYAVGTLIFLAIFLAVVTAQIRRKSFNAYLYWLTIVATTTVGTTIADFVDRSLGIGYLGGSTLLLTCLMGSLSVWRWSEGTVSVNTITTPKAETFYWVTILFSQTLGTRARRLGRRHERSGLWRRRNPVRRGARRHSRALCRHTDVACDAVLGCFHSHAAARRHARRSARQAPGQRRLRNQPLSRLRNPCRAYRCADCGVAETGRRPSQRRWPRIVTG